MKKLTLIISISLICSFNQYTIAQQTFLKLDISFYSPILDEVKMIDIYLPGNYYINLEQQYATIYYLHGADGDENSGNSRAMLYYMLHNEDTTISSPPAIFVCPSGDCPPYLGSCYLNSELYGNYEDYIIQDVIGFIENNFRAIPHKNFRFLTGRSMGGFGTGWFSVSYPHMFRAGMPIVGFFSMPDTLIYGWREHVYNENGSFNLNYNAGTYTKLLFTICGGFSPNMEIEPYHIEIPYDTLGNIVDTVVEKWRQFDISSKVRDIPQTEEMAYYLVCGTADDMLTYPTYMIFMDSLDTYGIEYDHFYVEGAGHLSDYTEAWMEGLPWIDSIINLEYQTMGIKIIEQAVTHFTVFPNPVMDYFSIDYELSKSSNVLIYLTDQQGKQISIVDKLEKPVGKHKDQFDISNLEAGVYYITLNTESNKLTRKIIKL